MTEGQDKPTRGRPTTRYTTDLGFEVAIQRVAGAGKPKPAPSGKKPPKAKKRSK